MVINYNLFTPGKPLMSNTLWVAEQIPGYIESYDSYPEIPQTYFFTSADVTSQLERGYWPSYNSNSYLW